MAINCRRIGRALAFVALLVTGGQSAPSPRRLDSMDSPADWSVVKSDGIAATMSSVAGANGKAIRLDVDFQGRSGYAVATRALPLTFVGNYELSFKLKGSRNSHLRRSWKPKSGITPSGS